MAIHFRQQIKNQLEQQAEIMASEESDQKLTESLLVTCMSFFRIAKTIMPKELDRDQFEKLYACYLGAAAQFKDFCSSHTAYFSEDQSVRLKDLNKDINSLTQAKNGLDARIKKLEENVRKLNEEIVLLNDSVSKLQKNEKDLQKQKKDLSDERTRLDDSIIQLGKELIFIREEIKRMEDEAKHLTEEVARARDAYQDLAAYYMEIEKIKAAISSEGYVDVESFSQAIHTMNEKTENLISEYDKLLKNLSDDVRNLQQKIIDRSSLR